MKGTLLIGFIMSVFTTSLPAHTFYEGITSIASNPRSGHIEIVHRFTTHDLTLMLAQTLQRKVNAEQEDYATLIQDYFEQHFSLSFDAEALELTWVGIESGIYETTVYQELKQRQPLHKLVVMNNILIDFFPQQVNRVNFSDGESHRTLIFQAAHIKQQMLSNKN